MSRKSEPCNKFAANIFNKAKCQNCFRPREEHLLNDSDMSQQVEPKPPEEPPEKPGAKVTACGWMYRAPDLIDFSNPAQRSRKWQRRWFVLFEHGGLVFSLDENPSTIPQGTINMNQCTEVFDGQARTGKENCLTIVTPDSTDYVSTDNKFDIDRWYEVLVIYPRSKKMKNKRNFTIPGRKADSPDLDRPLEGGTALSGQEKTSDEEDKENQKARPRQPTRVTVVSLTFPTVQKIPSFPWIQDVPGQPEKEKDSEVGTSPREPLSPTTVTSQPPTILPQKADKDTKNVNGDLKGQRKETNLERYNTMSSKQPDRKGSVGGSSRGTSKSQSPEEQQGKTPSEDSSDEASRKAGTMYETFSSTDIRDERRRRKTSDSYAKIADVPKAKRYEATDFPSESGATSQDAEEDDDEEGTSSEEEDSSESEPEVAPQEPVSEPPAVEKKPDSAASSPDKQRPKSLGVEDFEKLLGEKPKPILRLYDQLEALEPDWPREQVREGRSERRGRKESREEPPSMRRRNAAMQAAQRRARSLGPEVRYTDNISPELLNLKKGWLNVQGSTEKEWTKHWFVLSGHGLRYYKDAKAEEAGTYDGAIDLDTCYEVSEKTSQRNYGFLVKTHSGVYNLSAMTSGIRRNWIEAIRKVMPASLRPPSPDITKDAKPPPRREEQEMSPERREVHRRRALLPDTEQMLYGDKPPGGIDAKKSGWQHPGRKRTREERPKTMDISVIRDQYRQRNRDSVHEQRSSDDMLRRPSASKTPLVTEPRRVATGPVPASLPAEPPAETDGRKQEASQEAVQRKEEEKKRLAEIERLKEDKERRQAQTDSTLVDLLETEVESLKAKLEKTQQDLVNVHEENVELKMQLAATRREHLQSYVEMESEQSTYLTQIEDINQSWHYLRNLNSELQGQLEDQKSRADLTNIQVQTLKNQLTDAKETSRKQDAEIRSLKTKLDISNSEITIGESALKKAQGYLEMERERSLEQVEDIKGKVKALEDKLVQSEVQLQKVREEMAEKIRQLQNLSKEKEKDSENSRLVERLMGRIEDLKGRLDESGKEQQQNEERLQRRMERLQNKYEGEKKFLEETIKDTEDKLKETEDKLKVQMERVQRDKQRDEEEITEQVHSLERRLKDADVMIKQRSEQLQMERQGKGPLVSKVNSLTSRVEEQDKEIQALRSRLQEKGTSGMQTQLEETVRELQASQQRVQELESELTERAEIIQQLENGGSMSPTGTDKLQKENSDLKEKQDSTLKRMKHLQGQLNDMHDRFDALELQNMQLQEELRTSEESNKQEMDLMAGKVTDLTEKLNAAEKKLRESGHKLTRKPTDAAVPKDLDDKLKDIEEKLSDGQKTMEAQDRQAGQLTAQVASVEKKVLVAVGTDAADAEEAEGWGSGTEADTADKMRGAKKKQGRSIDADNPSSSDSDMGEAASSKEGKLLGRIKNLEKVLKEKEVKLKEVTAKLVDQTTKEIGSRKDHHAKLLQSESKAKEIEKSSAAKIQDLTKDLERERRNQTKALEGVVEKYKDVQQRIAYSWSILDDGRDKLFSALKLASKDAGVKRRLSEVESKMCETLARLKVAENMCQTQNQKVLQGGAGPVPKPDVPSSLSLPQWVAGVLTDSDQTLSSPQEQIQYRGDSSALQAAILTEMARSLEEAPQGRVPSGKELQLSEFEDLLARIRRLEAVIKNEEVPSESFSALSGRTVLSQVDVPTVLDHVLQDSSSTPGDLQKYNEAKSQCEAETAELLTELSRQDRFADLDLFSLVKSVAAGAVRKYSPESLSDRPNKQPISEKEVAKRLQAAKSDARLGQQQLSGLLETYQSTKVSAIAAAMARDVLQCANTAAANASPVTVSLAASQDMDAKLQEQVATLETKRAAAQVLGRETMWSEVFLNIQQGCDAHLRKLHQEKQSSSYRFHSHAGWLDGKYSVVQKTLQEDVRVASEKLKQAFDAALDRAASESAPSSGGETYSLRSVSHFADVVCNWAVVKAMSDHLGSKEPEGAKPRQGDASLRPSKLSGFLLDKAHEAASSAKDVRGKNPPGMPTTEKSEQHRHVAMAIQRAVHQAESEYLSMYLRTEQERQASAFQQVFQDVRGSPSARTLESLAIEHSRNIIDTREKYESLLQRERQESTNQIAGMQEELETLRQTQMKKTHCDTCTSPIQIEGKSVSVDQEVKIQDMASRHKKEVSQLREGHQKELDQLKTQLQTSQEDLQRKNRESIAEVDQLTELIETLKHQHEEEVGGLRDALAREIDSAREEVTRSFQKTVASVGCSTEEEAEFVSGDVLRERLEELEQEWEEKLAAAKQAHEDDLEQVRNDMLTAVRFAQEAAKTDQESEELRKRVQELEEEIHQVEAEYEEALRRQKEEFERALHRSQASGVPGKEHSKKYEEELDSIKAVSDQALSSLEDSHQRMLDDMKRAHQRELEKVEEQKETLLAEETAATIAAIEAMKKAHRDELVREVAKARMEAGQTSQDLEDIRQEHQKEIEALNREVEVLSKQFSAKCVEKSHLDQRVETQAATIKEVQGKLQDLMQQNQELSARLTEEMKRVQRLESGGTRELSGGKDNPNLYELQVSLRVKQSELQYLRQEVGSLKEELKSARRDQLHLAEKHQRLVLEYEGLRVRHDRQVASLRSQLDERGQDDEPGAAKNLPEVVPEEEPVFVGAATASSVRYSPSAGASSSRYTSSATAPSAYDIQRSKSTPDFLTVALPEAGSTTERHFSDDTEPIRVKLRRSKSLERGPRSGRVADRLRLFETP
ncbi:golgin subfamily A member 4-like isoform X3 [Branchiostoma lanceolatum]|uniref:golgin subfamily A member 4-like isoform X3 n=1 Tax=Branchiostoma lanceolatum TaxID=7740 RepID=UPI0034558E9F